MAAEIARLVGRRHLLLLTDFDGTLSELAPRPELAVVSDAVLTEVKELTALQSVTFGVVSGRRLADVAGRVGHMATFVAGLHGLEIAGPAVSFRHPVLETIAPVIARLKEVGRQALGWCPGVLFEDKTYALSCHVRLAPADCAERALDQFESIADPELEGGVLKAMAGAAVMELLPAVDWHKGRACEWIRDCVRSRVGEPPAILYLGDDRTDEDAFAVLHDDDMVVGVGTRPHAQLIDWRLAGPDSVGRLFGWLARLRSPIDDTVPPFRLR